MPDRTEALWRKLPGVRTTERSRFIFFAGVATLISLAQTLGLAGTEALFLARYGAEMLPVTFIAAALVTVFGSMVYASRVGVERNDDLFVQMLLGGAIALGAATFALASGRDTVLPALFCFFYLTQAVFVNHLWTFTGDYFDTVASKRLIPLFTVGGSVGGLVGGALIVGATRLVGAVGLIALWGILLAATAVWIRTARQRLRRWAPREADEADETSVEGIQAAMRYLGTSSLGRWSCLSAMTMMLSLFVVQYAYSDIFTDNFATSNSLASFFGIYLAATNLAEIAIEMRFTPWIIRRTGVPVSNLLHPLLTIATFGGLAASYGMASGIAARMNRELFENSVSGPVRALVYNAMPRRHRGRTRAFLEGIIVYAGMALAGVVLFCFENPDPIWLCSVGGGIAFVYLAANLQVRREYLRTLVSELRAGRLDLSDLGDELGKWEAQSLAELWEEMLRAESDAPSPSLLQLTPSLASHGLIEPLVREAAHPHPDVRRSCINALAGVGLEAAETTLLLALDDEEASVRLAALRGLVRGRASTRPLEPVMGQLLHDPDPGVRAEAAVHAGAAGEAVLADMLRSTARETVIAALRNLPEATLALASARLFDEDPSIRAATLEAFARSGGIPPLDESALFALAEDPDPRVRRAGVLLLANIDEPKAIDAITGAIGDPSAEVRFAAETVLGSLGDAGIRAVEPLLRAQRERTVRSALRVVSLVGTPAARTVLKGEFRHRVRALWSSLIAVSRLPVEASGVAAAFLQRAYADDIMRSRRLAFGILEFLTEPTTVRWVDRALHHGSFRARGDALEVLSHLGDRQAAQLLVLAHERGALEDKLPEVLEVVEIPSDASGFVDAARESDNRWIQMAARAIAAPETSHREEEELMKKLMALKQVSLFANLSFEQLEAIQKVTREVEYLPNEPIVKEGQPGGELFLLVEGRVRVFKNFGTRDERYLGTQEAVSYFGEMAAIDDEPRSATVVAAERSRMLCLDGERLKDLIREMPEIALQIMRVLTTRVRRAEATSQEQ